MAPKPSRVRNIQSTLLRFLDSKCVVTFTLPTRPPHVLLFTETLTCPRVTLGSLTPVLVALTRLTEPVPRVAVVARQAGVAVPSPGVPQTGETLAEQYHSY